MGQDGILRAGCQPALDGLFCKRREASYQLAASCQPCPTTPLAPSLYFATSMVWIKTDSAGEERVQGDPRGPGLRPTNN